MTMFWMFVYGNLRSFLSSRNSGLLEKNTRLHKKYKDKRIFIFFTGRSIQKVNFSAFENEYVMGTNFLALDPRFKELNAEFYCYTPKWDASWARLCAWGLHEIYDAVNTNVKLILNASSYYWINNFDFLGILDNRDKFKDNIYFINDTTFIPDGKSKICCGLKGEKMGVHSRSINIAIDLGFTDIYLLGSDYSKDPQRVGHFYGSTDFIEQERTQLQKEENLTIREFAKKSGVNIINVIDRDQTSFGYDSIFLDEVYSICSSDDKL